MSRFFSKRHEQLTPYTPGEQPKNMRYIKLNTNESPFPPSERAIAKAAEAARKLQLYPDPNGSALCEEIAQRMGVNADEVLLTNGSDEVLDFAFMAFCDEATPAAFADITYGFYPVYAKLHHIPFETIPLREDLRIDVKDYCGIGKTVFIANPNAPTGLALSVREIEEILISNPDHVVVIDEAYVDFGAESCIPLIRRYENLLVTGTFSKSRSMAGARLGFGIAARELIADLNTIKYSTNPYNVNSMTLAAGVGALEDETYFRENCEKIMENRAYLTKELRRLGFTVTDSKTNFVFAKHPRAEGKQLYLQLKERGILVRHFDQPRITQYNRITIGTREDMQTLIQTLQTILEVTP